MISNLPITFNFSELTLPAERELLEFYWKSMDENNKFIPLKKFFENRNDLSFELKHVNTIVNKYSNVVWHFAPCTSCQKEVSEKIRTRTDLGTFLYRHSYGYLQEDYSLCPQCKEQKKIKEAEERKRHWAEKNTLKAEKERYYFSSQPSGKNSIEDDIKSNLGSLNNKELTILFKIYQIGSFNGIKSNRDIFPNTQGEHRKYVYGLLYKFHRLGFYELVFQRNSTFILDIIFKDNVWEVLKDFQGQLQEDNDNLLPLNFNIISGAHVRKYLSNPVLLDTSITLHAGQMYEFYLTENIDKSLFLSVRNISEIKERRNSTNLSSNEVFKSIDDSSRLEEYDENDSPF